MSTPQRSQGRRTRRTVSGSGAVAPCRPTSSNSSTPLPQVQSAGCLQLPHPALLQRQHSASVSLATPRAQRAMASSSRTSSSSSLFYAGSKFTDSPMARHVPAPPKVWLCEMGAARPASVPTGRTSPAPSLLSSSGMSSIEETDASLSGFDTTADSGLGAGLVQNSQKPVRVHPLRLIAACAAV